ncbi:MAG: hypothetical protein AB7S93_09175 [Xanthobacteraceae bacterium]
MVVAVFAMRMMQPAVHEVIDMITVRDRLVTAARPVGMVPAMNFRRAMRRVRAVNGDHMLVNVIAVHVVQVAVVKIVDMAIVPDCSVSAPRTVLVRMVGMLLFATSRHGFASLFGLPATVRYCCPTFRRARPGAFHQTVEDGM